MCGWKKPLPDFGSFIQGLEALSGLSQQNKCLHLDLKAKGELSCGVEVGRGMGAGVLPGEKTFLLFQGSQRCRSIVSSIEMYKNSTVGGSWLWGGFCSQASVLAPFTSHQLPREPGSRVGRHMQYSILEHGSDESPKPKEPIITSLGKGTFRGPINIL